jgi:hypothetical protein
LSHSQLILVTTEKPKLHGIGLEATVILYQNMLEERKLA